MSYQFISERSNIVIQNQNQFITIYKIVSKLCQWFLKLPMRGIKGSIFSKNYVV